MITLNIKKVIKACNAGISDIEYRRSKKNESTLNYYRKRVRLTPWWQKAEYRQQTDDEVIQTNDYNISFNISYPTDVYANQLHRLKVLKSALIAHQSEGSDNIKISLTQWEDIRFHYE